MQSNIRPNWYWRVYKKPWPIRKTRGGLLQDSCHRAANLSQSPLLQCPHRQFAACASPSPRAKVPMLDQNRKSSCRTILSYTPSRQTRRLELLLPLASSTTWSSKAIFDGISHLKGLPQSQASTTSHSFSCPRANSTTSEHVLAHLKITSLIKHAIAQTVVSRMLIPIVRIFSDHDDPPAEGGLFLCQKVIAWALAAKEVAEYSPSALWVSL